ncbi:Alpha/Beta hydrolase protein [Aspergillus undulatus]|uniref:Alpha/Beta hydrolase protein n=1 Tax=Aspergillus undulatus TaxID=1810928 RepID=UPI003CCDAC13
MDFRQSLLFCLLAILPFTCAASSVINLGYTKYKGTALSSVVSQFLGMRYAEPPVGDLRWRAPRDPSTRSGVQSADQWPPIYCLFVNVFAASSLLVSVYTQGGGFVTNANTNYNVSDLVVYEEVRADGDLNVGLLDQCKLLHWFGGSPRHVVIQGASAGGTSAAHHLTAYDGRDDGLFVGAIGQSLAWTRFLTVRESEGHFAWLSSRFNCSAYSRMGCLWSLDPSTNLTALSTQLLFQPVVDGAFLTAPLYSLFQQDKFLDVPLILGYDTNKGSLFAANASTKSELSGPQIQEVVDHYPPNESVPGRGWYFSAESEIFADGVLLCPTTWICRSATGRANSDQPVWNYRYNFLDHIALAAGLGVPHTFETEVIFGSGQAESISAGFAGAGASYSTYNEAVVPVVQGYLTSFVNSLDPNTFRSPSSPEWELFEAEDEARLKLQTNRTEVERIPQVLLEKCEIWYIFEKSIVQM